MTDPEVIFVYNAGSGWFQKAADAVHKMVSPSTYPCRLCSLTYGDFSIKKEWKTFLDNLSIPISFLYKDEFVTQYRNSSSLPAVFLKENDVLHSLITKEEIEGYQSLGELQQNLLHKLKRV